MDLISRPDCFRMQSNHKTDMQQPQSIMKTHPQAIEVSPRVFIIDKIWNNKCDPYLKRLSADVVKRHMLENKKTDLLFRFCPMFLLKTNELIFPQPEYNIQDVLNFSKAMKGWLGFFSNSCCIVENPGDTEKFVFLLSCALRYSGLYESAKFAAEKILPKINTKGTLSFLTKHYLQCFESILCDQPIRTFPIFIKQLIFPFLDIFVKEDEPRIEISCNGLNILPKHFSLMYDDSYCIIHFGNIFIQGDVKISFIDTRDSVGGNLFEIYFNTLYADQGVKRFTRDEIFVLRSDCDSVYFHCDVVLVEDRDFQNNTETLTINAVNHSSFKDIVENKQSLSKTPAKQHFDILQAKNSDKNRELRIEKPDSYHLFQKDIGKSSGLKNNFYFRNAQGLAPDSRLIRSSSSVEYLIASHIRKTSGGLLDSLSNNYSNESYALQKDFSCMSAKFDTHVLNTDQTKIKINAFQGKHQFSLNCESNLRETYDTPTISNHKSYNFKENPHISRYVNNLTVDNGTRKSHSANICMSLQTNLIKPGINMFNSASHENLTSNSTIKGMIGLKVAKSIDSLTKIMFSRNKIMQTSKINQKLNLNRGSVGKIDFYEDFNSPESFLDSNENGKTIFENQSERNSSVQIYNDKSSYLQKKNFSLPDKKADNSSSVQKIKKNSDYRETTVFEGESKGLVLASQDHCRTIKNLSIHNFRKSTPLENEENICESFHKLKIQQTKSQENSEKAEFCNLKCSGNNKDNMENHYDSDTAKASFSSILSTFSPKDECADAQKENFDINSKIYTQVGEKLMTFRSNRKIYKTDSAEIENVQILVNHFTSEIDLDGFLSNIKTNLNRTYTKLLLHLGFTFDEILAIHDEKCSDKLQDTIKVINKSLNARVRDLKATQNPIEKTQISLPLTGAVLNKKPFYVQKNNASKILELMNIPTIPENITKPIESVQIKNTNLRKKPPIPKKKLQLPAEEPTMIAKRQLHWESLSSIQGTIFEKIHNIHVEIDLQKFEDWFCEPVKDSIQKIQTTKNTILSNEKRLFLVSLSLKTLEKRKIPLNNLPTFLKKNGTLLRIEELEAIKRIIPTEKEKTIIQSFLSKTPGFNFSLLAESERHLVENIDKVYLHDILGIYIFHKRYLDECGMIDMVLSNSKNLFIKIINSSNLKYIIKLILIIGNLINYEYSLSEKKKKTDIFKITSINMLLNYKPKKDDFTLIKFIYNTIISNNPSVLGIIKEFMNIHKLRYEDFNATRNIINGFITSFNDCLKSIENDNGKDDLKTMLNDDYLSLRELKKQYECVFFLIEDVKDYFGVNESINDVLKSISELVMRLERLYANQQKI